ncbi:hypothetical protein M011DRAFT_218660 [Sporormia fimetaria CBS 119925]|uniref:UbiA prenyltransferase n=1 Tax=Sporormia fimetaria CBS 119925 TaxID=1340428 RepID=A0A6A6UZ36_9PLEO|nr:hypothetical protein M011DRAFT_218660 [Sporormia fimetaria CBS 119925]
MPMTETAQQPKVRSVMSQSGAIQRYGTGSVMSEKLLDQTELEHDIPLLDKPQVLDDFQLLNPAPLLDPVNLFDKLQCLDKAQLLDHLKRLDKSQLSHLLGTLWLVSCDQVKDVIMPATFFGLCTALAGSVLRLPSFTALTTLQRGPTVVFYLWVLVLQFCLHNQRHTHSIEEDLLNKPWRVLPSGRISQKQANTILLFTYVLGGVPLSIYLGTTNIFAVYTILTLAYNEWGGSDALGFIRNGLCAGGYVCYFAGALKVAIGRQTTLTSSSWIWIFLLVTALFTTFHSQDFRDELGDKARGRKTVLTALGDRGARWILAVACIGWSLVLPMLYGLTWRGGLLPFVMAIAVAVMALMGMGKHDQKFDAKMYWVWCAWMISLCPTALLAAY